VLELKDKAKSLVLDSSRSPAAPSSLPPGAADLVSALVNLGYKPAQAEKASGMAVERAGPDASFELLFREAHKGLRSGA